MRARASGEVRPLTQRGGPPDPGRFGRRITHSDGRGEGLGRAPVGLSHGERARRSTDVHAGRGMNAPRAHGNVRPSRPKGASSLYLCGQGPRRGGHAWTDPDAHGPGDLHVDAGRRRASAREEREAQLCLIRLGALTDPHAFVRAAHAIATSRRKWPRRWRTLRWRSVRKSW